MSFFSCVCVCGKTLTEVWTCMHHSMCVTCWSVWRRVKCVRERESPWQICFFYTSSCLWTITWFNQALISCVMEGCAFVLQLSCSFHLPLSTARGGAGIIVTLNKCNFAKKKKIVVHWVCTVLSTCTIKCSTSSQNNGQIV